VLQGVWHKHLCVVVNVVPNWDGYLQQVHIVRVCMYVRACMYASTLEQAVASLRKPTCHARCPTDKLA
jgi:hypothetical protein